MMNGFTSVPFKIDDNFSQVAGVAKFSGAGIVLEFESKLFGIIKSGVKEVRIALDEILDVKLKKGVFKRGARIEIRLQSFTKLSEVPNSDGKITLKLARDDFERGAKAVERLQKDLGEHRESLPPTHTPVSRLFTEESEDETSNNG
ncbi:MAG TPA: hypothetical protein VF599_05335 [Pyrinomonadaceae bacterium]|jgi:hypothetical protein